MLVLANNVRTQGVRSIMEIVIRLSVLVILCCRVTADCGCTSDEVLAL